MERAIRVDGDMGKRSAIDFFAVANRRDVQRTAVVVDAIIADANAPERIVTF